MLATEATSKTEKQIVANVCEHLIYHGRVPVTCWGVVVALTLMQWESMRPRAGREN